MSTDPKDDPYSPFSTIARQQAEIVTLRRAIEELRDTVNVSQAIPAESELYSLLTRTTADYAHLSVIPTTELSMLRSYPKALLQALTSQARTSLLLSRLREAIQEALGTVQSCCDGTDPYQLAHGLEVALRLNTEDVLTLEAPISPVFEEHARYLTAFAHTHVASQDGTDRCAQCGLDLRDPIHAQPGKGLVQS